MKYLGLAVLGIAVLAPIWRDPAWTGGKSGISALWFLWTQPPKEHIPVAQAIAEASAAWEAAHPG